LSPIYFESLNRVPSSNDFELKTPGGHKLAISICQGVTTELWGLEDNIKATEVAAFVHRDHGDFSIG
jgi:cation-dependent mannose-6-phosphate receptor